MKKLIVLSICLGLFLCGRCQERICPDRFDPSDGNDMSQVESRLQSGGFLGQLTIPTVVHILHLGEEEGVGSNISTEQILSALQALNEDFGNADPQGGVDVEVDFCLASQDPDGNYTDGINRVDASGIENFTQEGIAAGSTSAGGASETEVKALSIWPRNDYLNIWVVHSIRGTSACSGIQGYAYFPNSSATRDGIVMDDNAFGTVGTVCASLSDGSILAHEAGHWMYLYHSFEGYCGQDVDNCENEGDRVCDTPPADIVFNCTPTCEGTGNPHLYMSYSNCKTQFSQGQKDRGRNAIESLRPTILTSSGCIDPAPCVGDLNGDNVVDIQDFIQLNSAFGTLCTGCVEDINSDGIVDIADFLILNSNYGNICLKGLVVKPENYSPINLTGVDVLGRYR